MTSNSFSPATLIGFNKTIAALRSISIVLVVLFHLRIPGFSGGFIGVDIFFVISGFLMTRQVLKGFLEGKNKRLQIVANFYGNRIRRLFPLAMFWIFSTLFLSFVFSKAYFDRTIVDAIASLMFLMNFRLIENANDYFDSKLSPSLLQHFWTLSVEMQLYIVLPIVFILVFSLFKGNVWRQRTVAVAAAFLCVISLMLQITTDQFVTNYYDTLLRMFPFFSGACLAILRNFRKPNYPNHGFSRFISILCFLGIGILQLTSINSANYLGGG